MFAIVIDSYIFEKVGETMTIYELHTFTNPEWLHYRQQTHIQIW